MNKPYSKCYGGFCTFVLTDPMTLSWRSCRFEPLRAYRSMLDCMEVLAISAKQEIRVHAIKGNWHVDEIIQGEIVAMVFSMAAGIERGLISARTKEALRARRASGLPCMASFS